MLILHDAQRSCTSPRPQFTANYLPSNTFCSFYFSFFPPLFRLILFIRSLPCVVNRVFVISALHDCMMEDAYTGMIDANESSPREEIFLAKRSSRSRRGCFQITSWIIQYLCNHDTGTIKYSFDR